MTSGYHYWSASVRGTPGSFPCCFCYDCDERSHISEAAAAA